MTGDTLTVEHLKKMMDALPPRVKCGIPCFDEMDLDRLNLVVSVESPRSHVACPRCDGHLVKHDGMIYHLEPFETGQIETDLILM